MIQDLEEEKDEEEVRTSDISDQYNFIQKVEMQFFLLLLIQKRFYFIKNQD